MTNYLSVKVFRVPRDLALKTNEHLRSVGRRGLEGIALWAGRMFEETICVTELIVPAQSGLRTESGLCVYVAGDELHRLNVHLYERQLKLVAQIHSHPTEAFHSDTDDAYAIATVLGSLSIVVPDFASRPFSVQDCAVYRLEDQGWIEVPPASTSQLIAVED